MRVWTTAACLALAVPLAALAGCGGSGPSRSEFISRADRICASAASEIRRVPQPANLAAAEAYFRSSRQIVEGVRKRIGDLPEPKADRQAIAAYLDSFAPPLAAYHQLESASRRGDAAGVRRAAAGLRRVSARTDRLARDLGMERCGSTA